MPTACVQQYQGQKMNILAFTLQEKVQCVREYFQTTYTTTSRRNFHLKYGNARAARTTILRWVQKVDYPVTSANTSTRGRPLVHAQTFQTAITYFHTHPER